MVARGSGMRGLKVQLGKHPNFMKYFKTYYIKVGIMETSHITLQSHKNSVRFHLKIGQFAPFLNENGRYLMDGLRMR